MSLVRSCRNLCSGPLAQRGLLIVQTRRDKLIGQVVGDANHEKVADVLDVGIVAIPVAPNHIGECA